MTDLRKSTSVAPVGTGRTFAWPGMLFLSAQFGLVCFLAIGDIGFDHPGKLGLDFDDFVLIAVLYGIVFIAGLAWSIAKKHWKSAVVQICTPGRTCWVQLSTISAIQRGSVSASEGKVEI